MHVKNTGNAFFQKVIFPMVFALIMLFAAYELLETSSQGFISMKITGFKRGVEEASTTLVLINNSSENRKGILLILLGFENSRISENTSSYSFTRFEKADSNIITLAPYEEKEVYINVALETDIERIVLVYYYGSEEVYTNCSEIVLDRRQTLWVQNWLR
ncbi:MAG: hypothetical protein ACUVQ0_06590 [Thermoproteota archaeon]